MMDGTIGKAFPKVSPKQVVDFGLVLVAVLLFCGIYFHQPTCFNAAFVLALVTIILPRVFYPFAVLWFGLSGVLNAITSRIMMTLIFFLVLLPVGLLRKLAGKDSLRLRQFKKGKQSVMTDRNHLYTKDDLLNMF